MSKKNELAGQRLMQSKFFKTLAFVLFILTGLGNSAICADLELPVPQPFNLIEFLTNTPAITIEFTRTLEAYPVAFRVDEEEKAKKFAQSLKEGKVKLQRKSQLFILNLDKKTKRFANTNCLNETLKLFESNGVPQCEAQGCCESGCWSQLNGSLLVSTNECTYDSVMNEENGAVFWNSYRMASEILRFGMYELDERHIEFNKKTGRWEGKTEMGDKASFSLITDESGSVHKIEYSVPARNIKRDAVIHYATNNGILLPQEIDVYNIKSDRESVKACEFEVKKITLHQGTHATVPCPTLMLSEVKQPLFLYNHGNYIYVDTNGVQYAPKPPKPFFFRESGFKRLVVVSFFVISLVSLGFFLFRCQQDKTNVPDDGNK